MRRRSRSRRSSRRSYGRSRKRGMSGRSKRLRIGYRL